MERRTLVGVGLGAAALMAIAAVATAETFVGTYQTDDGPNWTTVPDVYSAQEGAALIFGGVASDYRISTNSSMDENTITDTGWYSTIGVAGGQEYAHDYSLDLGAAGYGAAGWANGDDVSAYVEDNAIGSDFTMYVWRVDVPAPGALALLGLGGVAAFGRRRRA